MLVAVAGPLEHPCQRALWRGGDERPHCEFAGRKAREVFERVHRRFVVVPAELLDEVGEQHRLEAAKGGRGTLQHGQLAAEAARNMRL